MRYRRNNISRSHFAGKPAPLLDKDNPDWVPNRNLGHDYGKARPGSEERHERVVQRAEKRSRSASALALLELHQTTDQSDDPAESVRELCSPNKACQTDMSVQKLEEIQTENRALKEELQKYKLDFESFCGNDDKTLHFTGLPKWEMLLCLFNYVKDYLPDSRAGIDCLDKFQKFILSLMRMKLNLCGKDLGYRFGGISETTVSTMFKQVLDVLFV